MRQRILHASKRLAATWPSGPPSRIYTLPVAERIYLLDLAFLEILQFPLLALALTFGDLDFGFGREGIAHTH